MPGTDQRRRLVLTAVLLLASVNVLVFPAKVLFLMSQPELRDRIEPEYWVFVALSVPAAFAVAWGRGVYSGWTAWWRRLLHAALLLAVCTGAGFVTAGGLSDVGPSAGERSDGTGAVYGSAIVVLAYWLPLIGRWASHRTSAARHEPIPSRPAPGFFKKGREPGSGHVWWAEVPFDDDSGTKDRPCLVVHTFASYAQVLKITSKDQYGLPGYIHMPTETWDPDAHEDSWVELHTLRKLDYRAFRKQAGLCDMNVWHLVKQRHGR